MALQRQATRRPVIRPREATTYRIIPMLDIAMLALALGFFIAGVGYAYACERL